MGSRRRCSQCGVLVQGDQPDALCPSCQEKRASRETPIPVSFPEGSSAEPVSFRVRNVRPASRHFGDYELLGEIASGGMGVVYRARKTSNSHVVALKMILAPAGDSLAAHRFHTEVEAAAHLRHPQIVAVHDFGKIDGLLFYTMDLIEGRSLAEAGCEGRIPPDQAADWVRSIALGVHYAHQRGVLHRDLKPSNILIDTQGQARITDFGLAKFMHGHPDVTLTGQVLGSPSYMAPEQAEGRSREVSIRSDVYSLGAILYQLLTGRPPFLAANAVATLKRVVETPPEAPRTRNASVPAALEAICLKCLEKDPAHRYGSAQELADDLGRFLHHETTRAHVPTTLEQCRRWLKTATLPRWALVLGTLGLAASIGIISWLLRESSIEHQRADVLEHRIRSQWQAASVAAAWDAFRAGQPDLSRRLLQEHIPMPGQPDLRGPAWHELWQRLEEGQTPH